MAMPKPGKAKKAAKPKHSGGEPQPEIHRHYGKIRNVQGNQVHGNYQGDGDSVVENHRSDVVAGLAKIRQAAHRALPAHAEPPGEQFSHPAMRTAHRKTAAQSGTN